MRRGRDRAGGGDDVAEQDSTRSLRRMARTKVTARGFLAAAGLIGGSAAFLAACSGGGGASAATAAAAAPSARRRRRPASAGPAAAYATEGELFMYNWSDYVDPENMEEFKAAFGVENWSVRHLRPQRGAAGQAPGRRAGLYDVACPTAEFIPAMAEEGFIAKLDFGRIPNAAHINPTFQGLDGWDPTQDEYHVPKDWGTTGIMYRTKIVTEAIRPVAGVLRGRQAASTPAGSSWSTRRATSWPRRSRCWATRSTRPTRPSSARRASCCWTSPRTCWRSTRTRTRTSWPARRPSWASAGPAALVELRDEPGDGRHRVHRARATGTLYWMDTWVHAGRRARIPNAAYAWLNFIHEPENQAKETETNRLRDAERRGQEARRPGDPRRPGHLPARGRHRQPRGRRGRLHGPAARSTSGRSSSRASAADDAVPAPMTTATPAAPRPAPKRRRRRARPSCLTARSCSSGGLWYLVLLVAAAGHRDRLQLRRAGQNGGYAGGVHAGQLRQRPREPGPVHHSLMLAVARNAPVPARRPAAGVLHRDAGRHATRACSSSCSSSRSGRASSSGPTPG